VLFGTLNSFGRAVAVAMGSFGLKSGATLATVCCVRVEVTVMPSLAAPADRTRARSTGVGKRINKTSIVDIIAA
jgi:ACR3 family arsenite efflux pump ArsB